MTELPLDAAGRRRSPATMPGFHAGRPPRNKGIRYPADPAERRGDRGRHARRRPLLRDDCDRSLAATERNLSFSQ